MQIILDISAKNIPLDIWNVCGGVPIQGYEGRYWITKGGQIKRYYSWAKKWKTLKLTRVNPKCGYIYVALTNENGDTKSWLLHRLIAIHFIPNPDNKKYINHKNGIKIDNRISNLEWCTFSENQKHANLTGLNSTIKAQVASSKKRRKLKYGEAEEIRNIYFNTIDPPSQRVLGEMYGVSRSCIEQLLSLKSYHTFKEI